MKKIVVSMLVILFANLSYCNIDTVQTKSKITDVTVFFNGAQITRKADLKIGKGNYLFLFDRLPQEMNPQSIQIMGLDHCKILSVKHQLNYQNENKKGNDEIVIQGKIDKLQLRMKEIKNRISVFELEEKLLLDNSLLSKKNDGSSIEKIKAASEFYRLKLNEIKQGILDLITESESINKSIQGLNSQINEISSKNRKTYSQIMVVLECDREINDKMTISYYVNSAGWEPLYDFRVDDITKPLKIVYNANVYQSSGEDWNNVNIKLSSNNPSLSGNKPELPVWIFGKTISYKNEVTNEGIGSLKGSVKDDDTGESLSYINISIYKDDQQIAGGLSDLDGQFAIKPIEPGNYDIKILSVGYQKKLIKNVVIKPGINFLYDVGLAPSTLSLDEVQIVKYSDQLKDSENNEMREVSKRKDSRNLSDKDPDAVISSVAGIESNLRGARGENQYVYIDGIKKRGNETTNLIANTLKENITNLEYIIELPYTIPSDGEDYNLKIKEASFEVNYIYQAVPKIEDDAFLFAEIINYNELNLLSGKSSIYYQGTFTGESLIDASSASDTLSISLGRDKNIIVKREGNKQKNDKRLIGSTTKETVGWDITVKNNKNIKIKITVEDQLPISELKSIEVEKLEISNAKLEDKTGKLT